MDCDVSHVHRADLATVDALARASLNARRFGARLRLTNASPALQELIAFVGLGEVLFGGAERETEQREEPVGIEERVESDDPAA